jgi:hypothetical protein
MGTPLRVHEKFCAASDTKAISMPGDNYLFLFDFQNCGV